MLSHVSLGTNDATRAAAFYDPVLAVLGIRRLDVRGGSVDYGVCQTVFSLERPSDGNPASVGNGVHIAFDAGTRAQVDEFHRVALANARSRRQQDRGGHLHGRVTAALTSSRLRGFA